MTAHLPDHMTAALLTAHGQPLSVTTVLTPQPTPGHAVIRVRAAALCRSDIHIFEGRTETKPLPLILGHELSGDVAALHPTDLGNNSAQFNEGDRVFINPVIGCGSCDKCVIGYTNQCAKKGLLGISYEGGLAEYVLAPLANLIPIPDTISYDEAAMVESAGTAHNAVRTLDVQAGNHVIVIGAGGLGVQAIRLLTALGIHCTVIDPSQGALQRALTEGAVQAFTPDEAAAPGVLEGRFADGAVDCVGSTASVNLIAAHLKAGSICSIIGLDSDQFDIADAPALVRNSLRFAGIYTYSHQDLASVMGMLKSGQLSFTVEQERSYDLTAIDEIIRLFTEPTKRPARILVTP